MKWGKGGSRYKLPEPGGLEEGPTMFHMILSFSVASCCGFVIENIYHVNFGTRDSFSM